MVLRKIVYISQNVKNVHNCVYFSVTPDTGHELRRLWEKSKTRRIPNPHNNDTYRVDEVVFGTG